MRRSRPHDPPVKGNEFTAALQNPAAQLAAKVATRLALASHTRIFLPGDRLLQHAIDWGKQNLADLTQTASSLSNFWAAIASRIRCDASGPRSEAISASSISSRVAVSSAARLVKPVRLSATRSAVF